ncbi:hypothetical protein VNI00_016783 [Paramarasmius palmivorus]|uniref:Uncharacterized protein n=1 Tax=Paramarasmius palmivorus TaxID=297713 RepID=A0AAW0BCI2_9AGAR
MNLRISTFFAEASLSGAFSGILAYGIVRMDGVGGRTVLPRDMEGARFLNKEEKYYIDKVLREDYAHNDADAFTWKEVRKTFAGPQYVILSYFVSCPLTRCLDIAFYRPFLRALGYTSARAQLMSVPPFAAGFVVSLICAFISDKFQFRGLIVILGSTLAIIGSSIFLGSQSTHAQYASLFFSVSGAFTAAPTLGTWASNNATPQTRRATAIAVTVITSNGGGCWLHGFWEA